MGWVLRVMFLFLSSTILSTYGFDPLDPQGNITVTWDLIQSNNIKVSLYNYQLYRHIQRPGWKLSWDWKGKEVIFNMWGAEATEQGNCSAFSSQGQLPHCCLKHPVILDLLPGAPYNIQTANCCKGGVLSSMTQDASKFGATFQMVVGGAEDSTGFVMPENFTLGVPGYTCGNATEVPPTKFSSDKGRRKTQALATWNITCIYSQFVAAPAPKCCVSLSAFYNSTVVPCQRCSCSCQGLPGNRCVKPGETPTLVQQKLAPDQEAPAVVWCSRHMCPIRVHWHVKRSYKEYWRVKITITNLNVMRNYSEWNLVALHPNLQNVTQVFSFNYKPLNQFGYINDTGMFWGVQFYNDMLQQAGESGNVQTEMLLHKDKGMFTFSQGWAFPRRILFNGDECVMPSPDEYPWLPNAAISARSTLFVTFFSLLICSCIVVKDSFYS